MIFLDYVASGEGIPAQPRALRDETSPHRPPHNPTQQHQKYVVKRTGV